MPGLVVSRKLDSSVTVGPIRITVVGWGHRPGSREICQVKLLIQAPPEMHIERDDCKRRTPRDRPADNKVDSDAVHRGAARDATKVVP